MAISIISPGQVRTQADTGKPAALKGVGWTDALAGASSVGGQALLLNQGYNPAAMTQAATTGIIGGQQAFGGNAGAAPYYTPMAGIASPFGSGGYSYGGATYTPGYAGVGAGIGGGVPGSYGSVGASYGTTGAPSQDYQEKQALFQQMNDANWEMLVAQVTVNDLSRDYQARSNILKTKSDAEANSVRNMKA